MVVIIKVSLVSWIPCHLYSEVGRRAANIASLAHLRNQQCWRNARTSHQVSGISNIGAAGFSGFVLVTGSLFLNLSIFGGFRAFDD